MKSQSKSKLGLGGGVRAILSLGLVGFVVGVVGASEREQWRDRMMPITPRGYICQFTARPVEIDGNLNDPAWAAAQWTEDFVDIQGTTKPAPRFRTRAKMLWDEQYLYIAAELSEPHVWGTLTNHDAVIFQDPDFEVFIDPDGDTHDYYEFEMNALNTSWDLLLDKPYQDEGKAHNEWDIPGLKTAVQVRGTRNNPADVDDGWAVEIAFPWKVLSEHARHAGPPNDGEQWRMDFSRVEWLITINGAKYEKVPKRAEDNWVWSPAGVIDMHRPEMWGLVQFTRQAAGVAAAVKPMPGKSARDLALEIYYAQRDFQKAHSRWAGNLAELGIGGEQFAPGVGRPNLQLTSDGYTCAVSEMSGNIQHTWRIRQDRLLHLE